MNQVVNSEDFHHSEDAVFSRWNGWAVLWFLEYCEQLNPKVPRLKQSLDVQIVNDCINNLEKISFLQCFQNRDNLARFFASCNKSKCATDAYFPLFERYKVHVVQQVSGGVIPAMPSLKDSNIARFLIEKNTLHIRNQLQQDTKPKNGAPNNNKPKDTNSNHEPKQGKDEYNLLLKCTMIGNSGVGKSSLLSQLDEKKFDCDIKPSISCDFRASVQTFFASNCRSRVKNLIWDTPGREYLIDITTSYIRGTMMVYVVYDVTNRQSFVSASTTWMRNIKQYSGNRPITILIGNKCDLIDHREVLFEEGKQFAKENNCLFFEVSASTGLNIDFCFEYSTAVALIAYRPIIEERQNKICTIS